MTKLRKFLTIGVMVMTIIAMSGAFITPAKAAASAGDLIKMAGNSSVYYLGSDSKRYVFPNEATYFSWYKDFSGVITIPATELQSYMLGGNVTMRPGTKLVKIVTDPSVYAVEPNGVLRKIASEADAIALYGSTWATRVVDVADSFFTNYTVGSPLASNTYPKGSLLKNASSANIYYYDGTNYRLIASDAAFTANRFNNAYVVTTSMTLTAGGTSITAAETGITNTAQAGGTGPIITGSGLTVALASDTPAAMTLPKGATNVVFTKFNVTAASDGDVTVNSIKVKRTGVGAVTEISNVYLYDGATRLTSGRSITSDTNTAEFTLNYLVPRGTTKTLSIVANINGTLTTAGSHAFGIETASAISSTGATVSGSFPVTGNTMSLSTAVSASTAVVDQVSASWNVKVGSVGTEVAKLSVVAGSDVQVKGITLRNGGTLANSYLQNLKMSVNSSQVATASMTGDKAIFTFATPFTITKGQQKNFTITGDITGGRTTDNIKFYIDETSDVNVMDAVYSVGAQVTNNFALGDQIVSLEGGDITMSDNGPTNTTYSVNTTNKDLLKVSVNSQRNVTVRKAKVTIDFGGSFDTTTGAGDFPKIKNIRIVDTSTGSTLVGPVADLTASNFVGNSVTACNNSGNSYCYAVLTDTFDIAANSTRNLAIQADFDTNLTSGSTFVAGLDLSGANYIYDNDSGEYVASAKVVPGSITGKTMTVNSSNVDITKSSTPATSTFVKGANVDALGVSFNTTVADALKLNKFVARIYADNDGTFDNSGYGDIAGNTIVESASLYDGTTLVKGPVGLTLVGTIGASGGYYKAEFTNLAYNMAAGSSKKLTVQLKLRNSYSGTNYVAVDVEKGDLEIENSAGNLLSGLSGNLNLNGSPSPVITAKQSGTLTVAVDGATPTADLATTGATGVDVTKYRFSATDEAFDIVGLKLTNGGSSDADVSKVTLSYTDGSGVAVTKDGYLSSGTLTFNDGQLGIRVPKDSNAVLTIKVDTNTITGGATSGDTIKIGLTKAGSQWTSGSTLTDEFIAQGVSSGQKLYGLTDTATLGTIDNTNVAALTVAKTKVVVANNKVDGSNTVSANNLIGVYRFTSSPEAGSNQNSTLTKATIQLSGSMISDAGNHTVTVRFYNSSTYDSNHLMGSVNLTSTPGSTNAVEANLTNYNEFNGVQDVYVVVDSTDSDLTPGTTGTKSLSSTITTFKWNDGKGVVTPVSGIPVVGATNNYSL